MFALNGVKPLTITTDKQLAHFVNYWFINPNKTIELNHKSMCVSQIQIICLLQQAILLCFPEDSIVQPIYVLCRKLVHILKWLHNGSPSEVLLLPIVANINAAFPLLIAPIGKNIFRILLLCKSIIEQRHFVLSLLSDRHRIPMKRSSLALELREEKPRTNNGPSRGAQTK